MSASVRSLADEPPTVALLQMLVHVSKYRLTRRLLSLQLRLPTIIQVVFPNILEPEPQRRNVYLMLILLEEHPPQHFGTLKHAGRNEGRRLRSVGKVRVCCVAFGQEGRYPDLENWYLAV